MAIIFVFLVGLAFGSFFNVVIYRLHEEKSLFFPPSFCPRCKKKILWYDNIPLLSYCLLGGKCRFCRGEISWQYPLVEIVTALIFACLFWHYGFSFVFFKYLVFSCFLVIIFLYDLKYSLILDRVSVPAMIIALILNWYGGISLINLILAGVLGGSFFATQYFFSGGRWVGGGDIRLGALMGFMLGWPQILVALFIAYLSGALVGVILIARRRAKMSTPIPFAVFLVPATFITLIYGQKILDWYLNLIMF